MGNIEKVLQKFGSYAFIGIITGGQLQGYRQHIQTVHSHPAGSVRLVQLYITGQFFAAIEYADIIQSQKAALKYVSFIGIFSVNPPRKVDQQFMKNVLQEAVITFAVHPFLNAEDA